MLENDSPSDPIPLDVFLNGERTYVQGTQMLARAAEILDGEDVMLEAAGFHEITDQNVGILVRESVEDQLEGTLGSATFRHSDGAARKVFFVALPGTAPRMTVPPHCSYDRTPGSGEEPLSGDFAVASLQVPEDFFDALIQAVKQLHEGLGAGVRDIWFTGLRAAQIPVTAPFPAPEGLLEIRYRRLLAHDASWQTLLAARFFDSAGASLAKAMISFAFKSETRPHVD